MAAWPICPIMTSHLLQKLTGRPRLKPVLFTEFRRRCPLATGCAGSSKDILASPVSVEVNE
jgi:hypothetical protein